VGDVKRGLFAVTVLALIVGSFGYIRSRADEKTARKAAPAELVADDVSNPTDIPAPRPPAAEPAEQVRVASVQAPQPAPGLAEPALMSKLRDVADSAPLVALALAREGNQRFPDSPDAPERAWWVCKSLVNLTDFDEARVEARAMVLRYPGTPFTLDIERHLLINPGGPPESPPEDTEPTP
jgi:hypothetical protein